MNESLKLAIDAREAKQGAREWGTSIDSISRDARKAGQSVDKVERKVDGFGRTATRVGAVASGVFLGLASVQSARQVISIVSSYEQSLKLLQSISGASNDDLQDLNETARLYGATTRFSATQAAEGLIELAKAGQDVEQQIATLPSVLNLATVGQLELGTASTILVSTLAQYNLTAGESSRVTDILTAAANSSLSSVDSLALSLSFAGTTAASVNLTVEETAAALAVLANNAIGGARGGTALRGIIGTLLKPTTEARKVFAGLGVDLETIDLETVNLIDVLGVLRDAELSTKDATTIFGRELQAAALALINGSEQAEQFAKNFEEVDGVSQAFADNLNDTLIGSTLSLISALQELALQLGDGGLSGAMRETVDFATQVVRAIGGIEDELNPVSTAAAATAAQLQILTKVAIAFAAGTLIGALVKVAALLKTIQLRIIAINIAQAKNPFGLLAAGITLAIGELIQIDKLLGETGVSVNSVRQEVLDLKSALDALDGLDGVINRAIASGDPELISRAFTKFKSALDAEITQLFDDANSDTQVALGDLVALFPEQLQGLTEQLTNPIRDARRGTRLELKRLRNDIEAEIRGLYDGSIDVAPDAIGDPGPTRRIVEIVAAKDELKRVNDEIAKLSTPLANETVSAAEAIEFLEGTIDEISDKILVYDEAIVKTVDDTVKVEKVTKETAKALDRLSQIKNDLILRTVRMNEIDEATTQTLRQVGNTIRDSNLSFNERLRILSEYATLSRNAFRAEAEFELLDTVESVERKTEIMARLNDEYARNATVVNFAIQAEELFGAGSEEAIGIIGRYAEALDALRTVQERQSARETVEERLEAQRAEIEIIGRLSDSYERSRAIIEFADLANRAFGQGTEAANAAIEEYAENLDRLADQEDKMRNLRRLGDELSNALGTAFTDAIVGGKAFDEVLSTLLQSLINVAFQAFVVSALTSAIGGIGTGGNTGTGILGAIFGAKGMDIQGGNPKYFADGGFIDQRVIFPLNNGRVGVAGEAGKELLATPGKLPNGDMGFRLEGETGGTTNIFNIHTEDADSFKRSSRQIRDKFKEITG